jgi:hypothetical protein
MFALGLRSSARQLTVAVFVAIVFLVPALPARADVVPAAVVHQAQAKRATTSLTSPATQGLTVGAPRPPVAGGAGLLYFAGPPTGVNVGGRVSVGKSHVYVPYYGIVSNDPTHPGVQGAAGLAYGFRTWDISVFNGPLGSAPGASIPGATPNDSKVNPSLSFSIRF